MGRLQGDPDQFTADVAKLYGKPVVDSGNAKAPLAMMRMVPDGPDHPSTPAMRTIAELCVGFRYPRRNRLGYEGPYFGIRPSGHEAILSGCACY